MHFFLVISICFYKPKIIHKYNYLRFTEIIDCLITFFSMRIENKMNDLIIHAIKQSKKVFLKQSVIKLNLLSPFYLWE